jgi:hypothetical protein
LAKAEAVKVAEKIAPDMKALQGALAQAKAMLKGADKRAVTSSAAGVCLDACLVEKAGVLVAEISSTIKGVVGKLGLGEKETPIINILAISSNSSHRLRYRSC